MFKIQLVLIVLCHWATGQTTPSGSLDLNIMVSTGYAGVEGYDYSEVINTDTMTSCPNIPERFPKGVEKAVGMKHNGKMVICDDDTFCHSYANDHWSLEPFLLTPVRYGADSAEIRPGEWLVIGGYSWQVTGGALSSVKLLKNGIFNTYSSIPTKSHGGSSAMLNETHLFIACGWSGQYELTNYLLEIETERYHRIASRTLQPFEFHSSGTFYNSTAGEIQVANIGRYGIEVYSPSLDRWHTGDYFSGGMYWLYKAATIQEGSDSFLVIGGQTNSGTFPTIYRFDETGLYALKQNALSVPRTYPVALPIDRNEFECQ